MEECIKAAMNGPSVPAAIMRKAHLVMAGFVTWQTCQHGLRSHAIEILTGPHEIRMVVGNEGEHVRELIRIITLMGCHTNLTFETGICDQPDHEGSHLDRFWPGSKNSQGAQGISILRANFSTIF